MPTYILVHHNGRYAIAADTDADAMAMARGMARDWSLCCCSLFGSGGMLDF